MNDHERLRRGALGPAPSAWGRGVLLRYLIVLVGAIAITATLLLFMQRAAEGLRRIDPLKYFEVANFIPAPDGRRMPKAPPKPAAQPARPVVGYDADSGATGAEQEPEVTPDLSAAPAPVEPKLEESPKQ